MKPLVRAIYRRVSSSEQADSRLGLESQEALCVSALSREQSCLSSITALTYTDAGVSGSVPLATRPDGRRMCEAIERGEIGVVVVLAQDRLFRGLLDMLATLERWDELGVRVLCVDGGFIDMTDNDKWLSTVIRGVFAEKERRDARTRTKRALRAAVDRGRRVGGVPFGLRATARMEGGRKVDSGVYVAVPEQQSVIADIRRLRSGGHTFRDIANWLNNRSVPAPRGERWHSEAVRRVCVRA